MQDLNWAPPLYGPYRTEEIEMNETEQEFTTSIKLRPNAPPSLIFHGGTKLWLTISPDGVMTVGDGISEDEATQRVAAMLAERYSTLHKKQADEIARLRELLGLGD